MEPYYQDDAVRLYHGDARDVLPNLGELVDLVLTDPPYSSGGMTRSDRNQTTGDKYRMTSVRKIDPDFSGDNRDQRSFQLWCSYWMADAFRATRNGGAFGCFIDWRQIPCVVDALQVGGWVYRGLVVWDKGPGTRPMGGWFRSQCEFVALASSGPIQRDKDTAGLFQPGIFRHGVVGAQKAHLTEKPVALCADIIRTRDEWQTVLDPFAGSGTTLRAAKDLGRKAIGVELSEEYCEIAARRLMQEVLL